MTRHCEERSDAAIKKYRALGSGLPRFARNDRYGMKDFGKSDDPRVQAQLERLAKLSLPQGRIGLETMRALLERLGNPQDRLPPVFHVAGTNGKGSVCAFLRAMLEAEGKTVHVTTSPHLVRYNERIRVAGKLIEDARLAELLEEVLNAAEGLTPSFFEVTIAAAFTEFARVRADACIVEVGLGGRFDATNVLKPDVLAACGIAALGIDHERFLLAPEDGAPEEPMARIAFEKAGIAKKGIPLVTMGECYPPEACAAIRTVVESTQAEPCDLAQHWDCNPTGTAMYYRDQWLPAEPVYLPRPALPGVHQVLNAGLAIAILRSQKRLNTTFTSAEAGIRSANWPGRLHRLRPGPLTALVPKQQLWLDGGHNPSAGQAIADHFEGSLHLVLGMLNNKDPRALLDPLGSRVATLQVVPIPGRESHHAGVFGEDARAAADVAEALLNTPSDHHPVLIAGSLYLAGEVLRLNDEVPD